MSTKPRTPLLFGIFVLVAALIFQAVPQNVVHAQSSSRTFKPTADAYVNASYPSTNFGTKVVLYTDSSPVMRGYLRFTVSGLNGAAVQSAKLRLHANSSNVTGITVNAESNNTWGETTVTYSNAPAPGGKIVTTPAITSGSWIVVDLSSYIKAEGTYNLVVTTTSTQTTNLSAREDSYYSPQLVVTYGAATAPTATRTTAPTQAAPTATKQPTTAPTAAPTATQQPTLGQPAPTQPAPTATAAPVTGAVYYAAPTGSDSNSGSAASPWRTVSKGISMLQPGDTLYLRSGTYAQSAPLKIAKTGTSASKRITIATAPGEPSLAVITGDTNGDGTAEVPAQFSWSALVQISSAYITLKNLEVSYSGGMGIISDGANNIIAGNKVHNIWRSAIFLRGADNLVDGNTVWRAADLNYCGGTIARKCNGNWEAGIAMGDPHDSSAPGVAPRFIVRNNTVYHTSGEGIICMHTDNGLIENNITYDNWALNIDLDQCSYTTIQKNLVYATSDTSWWNRSTHPTAGIMLSNEGIQDSSGGTYPIGHDDKVLNNIVAGSGIDIYFWTGDGGLTNSALVNTLIANNTLVDTGGTGGTALQFDAGPHSNTRIINNVVMNNNGSVAYAGSTGGLSFSHNLWSKTPPAAFSSSTDVVANPLLVDAAHAKAAGSVLADWYKLSSGSPAIGKGMALSEVPVDFWGTARTSPFDLGAHEYSK